MAIDKKKIGKWFKDNFVTSNASHSKQTAVPKPKSVHHEAAVLNRDSKKEFLKLFRQLTNARSSWEVWSDFVIMSACAISNAVDKSHFNEREDLYLKTIKRYTKNEQLIFPKLLAETMMALESNPEQDFLGEMYMSLELGNRRNGQFFTPYHISDLMARMSLDGIAERVKNEGYISISDPCCGGGAMLIAGLNEARKQLGKEGLNYQNHVMFVGQDIDMVVALMCYIQISLLGAAGYVKVGNSLTEPISTYDSSENYWFTPMWFSGAWSYRRIFNKPDDLIKKEKEWTD